MLSKPSAPSVYWRFGFLVSTALLVACERQEGAELTPSASSPPVAVEATFELVDLIDLKRKSVSRFGYAPASQTVFVSFDDPVHLIGQPEPPEHENELEQWSLVERKMVHRYQLPTNWIIDDLYPSPNGKLLGARLYGKEASEWCRYWLVDTEAHRVMVDEPCGELSRSLSFRFDKTGRAALFGGDATPASVTTYEARGARGAATTEGFVLPSTCDRCVVVQSGKGVRDAGLYYLDSADKRWLVSTSHWHDNYASTNDGAFVVTTTWGGEIIVWSTESKSEVSKLKWTTQYGYLVPDPPRDRFIVAEVTDGTSFLRELRRVRAQ